MMTPFLVSASMQCASLFGVYDSVDTRANSLQIDLTPEQNLILSFDEKSDRYSEIYIADGEQHEGDFGTTGLYYIATCSENHLNTVRIIPDVEAPVEYDYVLKGDTLTVNIKIAEHEREYAVFKKRK